MEGFRVTGVVPASNLFPRIKRDQGLTEGGLLGKEADTRNTLLSQDGSSDPYADVIFEHTEKERLKEYVIGYFSKRDLDSKFGRGGWRAIRRRCLRNEGQQKFRMIDNARTSRHNEAATTLETI